MSNEKGELIYEGKAKKIFKVVDNDDLVWLEYKNSLTAFNALKKGEFEGKGKLNCQMTSIIFHHLKEKGIANHFVALVGDNEMICNHLEIIPAEVVVRNILAGSTAKKFGIAEGTALNAPLVEFYYKDDELADPFMSDDQALMMKVVSNQAELNQLKKLALTVNSILIEFFHKMGIRLIDFKLEFGRDGDGEIILGDEITPDSCRLWDEKTGERMDKDRFRRDLGKVEESYRDVFDRMAQNWEV